jgi:hypothetical protein
MSLERRAAMATLLADRGDDLLVVPGLGSTCWDLAAAGDNDRNFYLWGAAGRRWSASAWRWRSRSGGSLS